MKDPHTLQDLHIEYAKQLLIAMIIEEGKAKLLLHLLSSKILHSASFQPLQMSKEVASRMFTGDLPISKDAMLSLRQRKPLLSHTPGRRVSNRQTLQQQQQQQQQVPPTIMHNSVSLKHLLTSQKQQTSN